MQKKYQQVFSTHANNPPNENISEISSHFNVTYMRMISHKYIHTFCFPSTSYYLSECAVFLAIWDMRCLAIKGLCVKNFLRTLTLFDPQCSENIFNNKIFLSCFFLFLFTNELVFTINETF